VWLSLFLGTTWLQSLLDESTKLNCLDPVQKTGSKPCKGGCKNPSHNKHGVGLEGVQAFGKTIFIFRDTRDVLCSHYHWASHGHKNISSFVRDSDWGVNAVIEEQNNMMHVADKLVGTSHHTLTYYEELKKNTVEELNRIARFLHMPLSPSQLKSVVEAASFETMREKELRGEMNLRVHPDSSVKLKAAEKQGKGADELFGVMTRKGEVGGFKDELDAALVVFVETKMTQFLTPKLRKRYLGKRSGVSVFASDEKGYPSAKRERSTRSKSRTAKKVDANEEGGSFKTQPAVDSSLLRDSQLGTKLAELKKWHDEGILTDGEFSASKAKALGI